MLFHYLRISDQKQEVVPFATDPEADGIIPPELEICVEDARRDAIPNTREEYLKSLEALGKLTIEGGKHNPLAHLFLVVLLMYTKQTLQIY